jgi:hypothetical protein
MSDPSKVSMQKDLDNGDPPATRSQKSVAKQGTRGGIMAALRRSPLVGSDLDLERDRTPCREIDL